MKRTLKPIVLALALLMAAPALAQQAGDSPSGDSQSSGQAPQLDQATLERARLLLSGYHGMPAKAALEASLPNARQVMWRLAHDADGFSMHRQRALAALGYWADDAVFGLYRDLLADADTDPLMRMRLVVLLAKHFGQRALPLVAPYLDHDDVQMRLSAIDAVRRIPGQPAQDALTDRLASETNTVARDRLVEATERVVR